MSKPILVGLLNPYSTLPNNALAPYPERSAGHRLWKTLQCVKSFDAHTGWSGFKASYDRPYYMEALDRRNLFVDRVPYEPERRKNIAAKMLKTFPQGVTVMLLGTEVLEAFSPILEEPLFKTLIHPQVRNGVTWRLLPHPSGRSRFYNDPATKALVGMLLADVLTHAAQEK